MKSTNTLSITPFSNAFMSLSTYSGWHLTIPFGCSDTSLSTTVSANGPTISTGLVIMKSHFSTLTYELMEGSSWRVPESE